MTIAYLSTVTITSISPAVKRLFSLFVPSSDVRILKVRDLSYLFTK